jgi:hypothetical protein
MNTEDDGDADFIASSLARTYPVIQFERYALQCQAGQGSLDR